MSGTYLYALTRPFQDAELEGLRGVAGEPVRTVVSGRLACVVSTVDLGEFGEEALRANLEDLSWLERTARQHDDVVRACARMTTTVPLRLATICANDGAARDRLAALGRGGLAALDELDGRDEWGVKLFAVEDEPRAAASAGQPAPARSSGVAYLQQRREQVAARTARADRWVEEADQVYRDLGSCAVRAHQHRPQDARLSGVAAPMLLNAAYLVERERTDEFRHAAEQIAAARPAGAVVVTGPWPPYSFATVDEP